MTTYRIGITKRKGAVGHERFHTKESERRLAGPVLGVPEVMPVSGE